MSLQRMLEKTGRFPPVDLMIKPLDGSKEIVLNRFLSYNFNSSMTVPVDTFSFTFVAPDDPLPFRRRVKEGDVAVLYANNEKIATGIIDQPEVETDADFGEKIQVTGRDLMGQLEDQDAISINDKPIWADNYTVSQVAGKLCENTRIKSQFTLQDAPKKGYLFATEPSESKLTALQRYLEPLNCLAWMNADGKMVVGRPNMAQAPSGTLILNKAKRQSNVLSMKSTRAASTIPGVVVPVWSGQELTTDRVPVQQRLQNAAQGPARLYKLGHRVVKTVTVSTPQGGSPQELSEVNRLSAGGSNLLQAHAKRELARANMKELMIQAVVAGHYNENGEPFKVDTTYMVDYDRDDVLEKMYLFAVDYTLDENGMKTHLTLCRLGTIVSDVRAL